MKKLTFLTLILTLCSFFCFAQFVGIGTTDPRAKLDVNGNIRIGDGTQGAGKVLTSDATGRASWQTLSTTSGFGAWGDCSTSNISGYNPITASNGTIQDKFGTSASINGNYAIVGAFNKTIGANASQGAAYIYFFNGTNWVEQQMLTASDGAANDFFGGTVSINGNYAIVGANYKTVGGNAIQGKAYIFFNNGTSWVQVGTGITASDGAANDYFGRVSINGNYAIVGAFNKTVGGNTGQGKAYIFFYNGSTWAQVGTGITASDGTAGDQFGVSVSINGNDAIIGAQNKNINGNFQQGKVYIFHNNSGTWQQVGTGITAVDGANEDVFGCSVSINGNYALIGAKFKTLGANTIQGKAYLYYYNGTTWEDQYLPLPIDGAAFDNFGANVFINSNYAIVGANTKTSGANTEQGAAYIYRNIAGVWRQFQKVTDPRGAAGDYFGNSVSTDGIRFLIGAQKIQFGRGMVFFGKMEE